MDFTVALILIAVAVVAVLAREGWQRARSQPTARYLEALRRVHDTAHTEETPTSGGEAAAASQSPPASQFPPASQSPPVSQFPPASQPPPVSQPALTRTDAPRPPFQPLGGAHISGGGRPRLPRILAGSRAVVAAVVIGAIVAVAGVGYVLANHAGSGPGTAVPTTAPATNRSTAPPTTSPVPATTAPAVPVVVAGAQSSGTAAYTVSSGPVQLAVAASSRCWVELRAVSALGPVVFEGILGPGASRAFENAVGLWVRIGYPAGVVLAVDGRPVGLPASASPLDVTVNSATA